MGIADSAPSADLMQLRPARHALRHAQSAPDTRTMGQEVNVGANIRRIRKEKGLTLEQVAAAAGTDTGNLSRLERGLQGATTVGLKAIAQAMNVTLGDLFAPAGRIAEQTEAPYSSLKIVEVPLLSVAGSMGNGRELPAHETVVDHIRLTDTWIRRNLTVTTPKNLAVISAYGDSMEDTFADGDILLVDRGINDVRLDAIYVLSREDALYIKRVQRRPDGGMNIISDNKKYEAFIVRDAERERFSVLGRVVWAWRGKKL